MDFIIKSLQLKHCHHSDLRCALHLNKSSVQFIFVGLEFFWDLWTDHLLKLIISIFPFRFQLKMQKYLISSLLANLIPWKIQRWPKFLFRNSCHTSINPWQILANEVSQFKSDCVQFGTSHILLIEIIDFKLCLTLFRPSLFSLYKVVDSCQGFCKVPL